MYQTTYHRASSLDQAAKLFENAEDARYVSGGQTLIPAMKTRLSAPSDVIDLRHVDGLKGITVAGREVTIGAGTTHAEVAANEQLRAACPALAELAAHIGDPHVRHMGTLGGSIANNDPAADYPAAMVGLNAVVHTSRREIAAAEFFTGLFETALEDGEIVTSVSFTAPTKCGYEKFRNPASRYAIVGVFVASGNDGVRVAVTGAGDNGVFRATVLEEALGSNFSADALDGIEVPAGEMMSDIHASAEYRASLVTVMAKRAVRKAAG